jgi:hypothetical protein
MPVVCRRVALLAASALIIAACGDSDSTTVPGGPSSEQVGAVGGTTRDEVEASLNALTLRTTIEPLGAGASGGVGSVGQPPCATPSSTTDSDGDGIPDDATFLFTAPPCRFTGFRGSTLDIVGQIRIQDPTLTDAGFGFLATLTSLRFTYTPASGGSVYSVTRNGTRTLTGSVSELQLATNLQVQRSFPGQSDAAVDQQWAVIFTPETPLALNQPLSSGMLDLQGTLNWTRGTESFDLTVSTPTPVHYNAGCSGDSRRIDAGEVHVNGTFGEVTGYVRIRWSECGKDPEVRFIEG